MLEALLLLLLPVNGSVYTVKKNISIRDTLSESMLEVLLLLLLLVNGSVYTVNPLPHCGRPFWPYTCLNAKYSKSAEGKVLLKIKHSSSFILCLF
jgi:hypothetical protein